MMERKHNLLQYPIAQWGEWIRSLSLLNNVISQKLFWLFFSTLLAEIAGNIMYVILVERAFEFGMATGVGGVLIVQSLAQVFLGIWVGGLVDFMGKRNSALLATLASAILALGISLSKTMLPLYLMSFLIMLARLILITSRLALVTLVADKKTLVKANITLSFLTGLGFFIGPALGAALMFLTKGIEAALMVTLAGYLISLPFLSGVPVPTRIRGNDRGIILEDIRSGWQFMRSHSPLWKALLCLFNATLIIGAVLSLIPLLVRQLGFESEGTGIFFSALGLGGLFGPILTLMVYRRTSLTTTLLLTGIVATLGVFSIGLVGNVTNTLFALGIVASANAGLNVIVVTILQRLTPPVKQGLIFGIEKTIAGIAWLVSQTGTTALAVYMQNEINIQNFILVVGLYGIISVFTCWLWSHRNLLPNPNALLHEQG